MPNFKYTARDSNGTEITGSIDAVNESVARDSLKAMSLEVVYLQAETQVESTIDSKDDAGIESDILQKQWKKLDDSTEFKNPASFAFAEPTNLHETIDETPKMPADSKHYEKESDSEYYPFSETLRLYAGWLLAWYGLVYILGYFQKTREIEPAIPFVFGLLYSPLVLTCTLIAFLYLLLHSIQRTLFYGYLSGLFLCCIGALVFILFRIHV